MTPQIDKPLSDDEVVALDAYLARLPEESNPLDVVMLDGFLVGVLLQPDLVSPADWLPRVFASDGAATPLPADDPERARAIELIMRRYNELAACIAAREPFDPIVFVHEDEHGAALTGKDGIAALAPWAVGFDDALAAFASLDEACARDEVLADTVAEILRHLPDLPDDEGDAPRDLAELRAALDRDAPLHDLDHALVELVEAALDIAETTRPNRPLTRAEPKVGRNDPCPCGSGRKFKACHGRELH
jgi:uncharacterized protein